MMTTRKDQLIRMLEHQLQQCIVAHSKKKVRFVLHSFTDIIGRLEQLSLPVRLKVNIKRLLAVLNEHKTNRDTKGDALAYALVHCCLMIRREHNWLINWWTGTLALCRSVTTVIELFDPLYKTRAFIHGRKPALVMSLAADRERLIATLERNNRKQAATIKQLTRDILASRDSIAQLWRLNTALQQERELQGEQHKRHVHGEELRAERRCQQLEAKESAVIALIGCSSPQRTGAVVTATAGVQQKTLTATSQCSGSAHVLPCDTTDNGENGYDRRRSDH